MNLDENKYGHINKPFPGNRGIDAGGGRRQAEGGGRNVVGLGVGVVPVYQGSSEYRTRRCPC